MMKERYQVPVDTRHQPPATGTRHLKVHERTYHPRGVKPETEIRDLKYSRQNTTCYFKGSKFDFNDDHLARTDIIPLDFCS